MIKSLLLDHGFGGTGTKDSTTGSMFHRLLESPDVEKAAATLEKMHLHTEEIVKNISASPVIIGETIAAIAQGLASKEPSLILWTCRILSRFAHNLRNEIDKGWWKSIYLSFKESSGLLSICVKCLDRHPAFERSILGVIEQFTHGNTFDFYAKHLGGSMIKNAQLVHRLLEYSERNALTRNALETSGQNVISHLMVSLIDCHDSASAQNRISIVMLINYLHQTYFSTTLEHFDKTLQLLKRGTHGTLVSYRVACLSCLFEILECFLYRKDDKRAVDIFRYIIFVMLEYHEDKATKSFLVVNLILTLNSHSKLPAYAIIDPLSKYLQTNPYDIFDMELILSLSKHASVEGVPAFRLIEFLWRIATTDACYGAIAKLSLCVLANRNTSLFEEIIEVHLEKSIECMRVVNSNVRSDILTAELLHAIIMLGHSNINSAILSGLEGSISAGSSPGDGVMHIQNLIHVMKI